ncbi:DNA-binding FadR family transcriptional regulator [Arthrobacter stackebrandtii]|uniref:DNA-binding FadR family transcriptional regulator n=1 Tax=Arthrobacter stackebrandtii TaxID=272161 RepID=A0ABS4YZ74_9MICC|nr:FCD domain-containing protein [Arthrobacter stackebrandtii]MBP2414100.1 DNA-binding FadR family transcriptional regulator [Arthrobacter stackebrandtii]PYG99357.1 GntR family transcriptional regulator [Arthrobacter stackebrandtii]
MAQVKRTSLAEQAADLLLERVRAGEWPLGSKLPGENTLGPQLGVGRSTVREAIRSLAGQGVLATRQGAGVFVASLDIVEDWSAALLQADINSVIEARIAIEVEAAALAAERRSPTELRAIRRAGDQRDAARSDIEAHVDADIAFHRAIVAAAHNPILVDLFDSFTPRSRQAMIDLLRLQGEFGSDADQHAHTRIVDAIADRDGPAAAVLAREHLSTLKMG